MSDYYVVSGGDDTRTSWDASGVRRGRKGARWGREWAGRGKRRAWWGTRGPHEL